ncbi:zf-TFIIB domain-containing protein [Leifsonia sp. NPDC014704]|uniref:Zf-TFIIB domain-containing protein n=1 Tax=Leifsonia virtsii TaxID=3035915 RepID=A0ABT8J2M2_9MICO|nr:zf-TFIIB domain-containing protein [Leifsonia virtsii]MDN4599321.1 zf-TFIIB domain-containing protein [Leifsonia virtsii]
MKCPVDGETLLLSERSGIEIDYCPACRGVWLDRGELDKIVERSEPGVSSPSGPADRDWGSSDSSGRYHGRGDAPAGKRRGGWLGELFGD